MNIIPYTAEHGGFRESLRKFLDREIVPHIEEWEEAGIVPRIFWKKMGEQGFLCTDIAEEYGGAGGDFLYSVIVMRRTCQTQLLGTGGIAAQRHLSSPISPPSPRRSRSTNISPAAFPETSLPPWP